VASAILDFWCACLDHREEYLAVFIAVQNLVGIGSIVLANVRYLLSPVRLSVVCRL